MQYTPPDAEIRSLADLPSWPDLGRVGFCPRGPDLGGSFVFVFRAGDGLWGIHSRRAGDLNDASDIDALLQDHEVLQLLSTDPVTWCPPSLDDPVEEQLFGTRRWMIRLKLRRLRSLSSARYLFRWHDRRKAEEAAHWIAGMSS